MTLTMYFTPRSMTATQYDEVIQRLEAAGEGAPSGRTFHVCFGSDDRLRVVDVWDSQESFDAFAETLGPILNELGIEAGDPEVSRVHNVIEARARGAV